MITQAIHRSAEAAANAEKSSLPRWTLKRLVNWCKVKWNFTCSRETIRRVLKRNNISWKKAKKLLNRADPEKRADYLKQLEPLLQQATRQEKLIVYIDEAHIHQDTDIGSGWSAKGGRLFVSSCSPGLSKVTFYGIYYYNEGQVRIWPYPKGNSQHTVNVLERIRQENLERQITVIWDGASYHRSFDVCEAAKNLKIELVWLPPYSPDFMPVEALWRWLREEVTYHYCHSTQDELVKNVKAFCVQINQKPVELADRLHTKTSLDEEEEVLRKPVKPKPK
ncbi:IS630 family transposase [Endozoicomonas ascidiicola]|uniref:IS630 family transposase n=1 Tax=Endozoicomonas ascidiicola TaxID=1698521 RepID=UPI0012F7E087